MAAMTSELPLGREVAYPRTYDPSLLFPIARDAGRGGLGLAAGTLPAGRDSLRAWIEDPQRFKPGARMPSYGHVEPETLDALAAWLEQLR